MHPIIRTLFECEQCGACCKITRSYSDSDIEVIKKHTGEPDEAIRSKLDSQICGYLENDVCTIHLVKPDVCRWWPGPGARDCPGYKKLAIKYDVPGAMSKFCNIPELGALYIKCMMKNDREAALELLRRLEIDP